MRKSNCEKVRQPWSAWCYESWCGWGRWGWTWPSPLWLAVRDYPAIDANVSWLQNEPMKRKHALVYFSILIVLHWLWRRIFWITCWCVHYQKNLWTRIVFTIGKRILQKTFFVYACLRFAQDQLDVPQCLTYWQKCSTLSLEDKRALHTKKSLHNSEAWWKERHGLAAFASWGPGHCASIERTIHSKEILQENFRKAVHDFKLMQQTIIQSTQINLLKPANPTLPRSPSPRVRVWQGEWACNNIRQGGNPCGLWLHGMEPRPNSHRWGWAVPGPNAMVWGRG